MSKRFLGSKGYLLRNHWSPTLHAPISQFHKLVSNPAIDFLLNEVEELRSAAPTQQNAQFTQQKIERSEQKDRSDPSTVQIAHPWPEWVELMELLLKQGYFQFIGNPFRSIELGAKESNQIRTASLNFARDRFDLIRYLSRKDIQVIAGCGCPSIDRKVVNSGKRLRAHVGIDEGNVCSSCILRGNCERAYVKARADEGGRTVDVMRFLLTYGLDPIIGAVDNKPCLNKKVKESVRKLVKEMVEIGFAEGKHSPPTAVTSTWNSSTKGNATHQGQDQIKVPMKQGDWICLKCNFLNFARNIKCLRCNGLFQERLSKLAEDQDFLPLKKGDWICNKCNFLNFAKNTRCLQCKEKPPRRQLNPGEWECESCNYINFRRNMVCLKCDHKRGKALSTEGNSAPLNDNTESRRAKSYFGQADSEETRAGKWNFVEDEVGSSSSWIEVPESMDFPVAGGKSDLSRNVQKQEKWKEEMTEMRRNAAKAKENADEFKSAITRSSRFLEATDDEEMDDWFEDGKNLRH